MWAVIASGQSLTDEQVNICRISREKGLLAGFIAVSNVGLDLAPDADALVSHDAAWWRKNKKALDFPNHKYCRDEVNGTIMFKPFFDRGLNSGLMACDVAHRVYKANKILLLGFDMHGTHYFGQHPEGLKNSTQIQFKRHLEQFDFWRGCDIVNCTPNSALKKFPYMELRDAIGC